MPAAYIVALLLLLQAAGCSTGGRTPDTGALPGNTAGVEQTAAPAATPPPAAADPVRSDAPPAVASEPRPPQTASPAPIAAAPVVAELPATVPAPPAAEAPQASISKADKPAAKAPAKVAAPPPPKPDVAAPARPQALPPLALATLEQRLKDTDAIGVFTKITLKNQVDDLLNRFKAHYEGSNKTTLAQLRQAYDQLLLKVHDLLKDRDPALASAIMNSREAIWAVLTDPVKFAKL